MKPILIIPAYNEEDTIYELTRTLEKCTSIPILVVDDGSDPPVKQNKLPDNTQLLVNEKNMGKGYSLKIAFTHAKNRLDVSHAIVIDADFQHDPKYITNFLETDSKCDFVLGVRNFNKTMPIHRKLSNTITSKLISMLTKKKIKDSQCGYRRYNVDKFVETDYVENGFQFESEILINGLRNNWTFTEIPVSTIYNNKNSKIRNISDTFKFIMLIARKLW